MRIRTVTNIDFGSDDNLLFLGFHGFGNDETEMIRIIEALYDGSDHEPNYMSFRGTYSRPFIGNNHWYPDGCSTEERRRECHDVGDAVIELLRSPAYVRFRKVLIGFSQGGYLSYRMVLEHPDSFGAAILMSPSFKGEEGSAPITGRTRGSHDSRHGPAHRTGQTRADRQSHVFRVSRHGPWHLRCRNR